MAFPLAQPRRSSRPSHSRRHRTASSSHTRPRWTTATTLTAAPAPSPSSQPPQPSPPSTLSQPLPPSASALRRHVDRKHRRSQRSAKPSDVEPYEASIASEIWTPESVYCTSTRTTQGSSTTVKTATATAWETASTSRCGPYSCGDCELYMEYCIGDCVGFVGEEYYEMPGWAWVQYSKEPGVDGIGYQHRRGNWNWNGRVRLFGCSGAHLPGLPENTTSRR
jgi:hypothetical protein